MALRDSSSSTGPLPGRGAVIDIDVKINIDVNVYIDVNINIDTNIRM